MDFYVSASESHKKRERALARKLRQSQWWKSRLSEGQCYYCGNRFDLSELTMDHKVPISRGGRTTKGNVVVCCKQCNTEKRHKTPVELQLESLEKSETEDRS